MQAGLDGGRKATEEFFQRRECKYPDIPLMDQRQKTEDGVTAHTQNSNAEKECCPQANNFRAIVLPAKLALGIDIIMEGGRRREARERPWLLDSFWAICPTVRSYILIFF